MYSNIEETLMFHHAVFLVVTPRAVDFVDLLDGRSLRHSMCMVIVIIISCDILTIVAKLPVDS